MSVGSADRKVVYIPCISDHAYAVAGAMRAHGFEAEVLPPPDDESLAIGRSLCRGRECLPCFLCTGDFLKLCRDPGFQRERAFLIMPTGPGPCRFGQYHVLQRQILAEEGFGDVPLLSPTTDDSYALFGRDPVGLRKLSFQGIAAVDLLTRILHAHRPYERETGASDRAYQAGLAGVVRAAEAGGGGALVGALEEAADRFSCVPLDDASARPLIAVMGEIYLMLNGRSNLELVRAVERAGGEVLLGTFTDWLLFVDHTRKERALLRRDYRDWMGGALSDAYQRWTVRKLTRAVRRALRRPPEASMREATGLLRFCYDPTLGSEAVLTMSRLLDVSRHGVSGIIDVLPFSCMPGMIVMSMAGRLRERMGGIPWLDVAFDGQRETNLRTRLEAFMHQAHQFHHRRGAA
jgi:predicted nucleotide-binding protein (sugar kinase/HSP70/actin superfamily)